MIESARSIIPASAAAEAVKGSSVGASVFLCPVSRSIQKRVHVDLLGQASHGPTKNYTIQLPALNYNQRR